MTFDQTDLEAGRYTTPVCTAALREAGAYDVSASCERPNKHDGWHRGPLHINGQRMQTQLTWLGAFSVDVQG